MGRSVLLASYFPPVVGGVATWTASLRDHAPGDQLTIIPFDYSVPPGRSKAAHAVVLAGRMQRRMRRPAPDVVHVNCCFSTLGIWRDLYVAAYAKRLGVPVVAHYRGSFAESARRMALVSQLALRALTRIATVNVGVTHDSQAILAHLARRRSVRYLANWVEDDWATPPRMERSSTAPASAVYVGRLSIDKGTPELLNVARLLPGVDFVLVGPVLAEVQSILLGRPANVVATGTLPRIEIRALLSAADVFVFPSRREGFPLAVLEAMAAGLPVVASDVGEIKAMIQPPFGGTIVNFADPASAAEAIGAFTADPERCRRAGSHNYESATQYRFSTVLAHLLRIYDEALA